MAELTEESAFGFKEKVLLLSFSCGVGILGAGLLYPFQSSVVRWRAHYQPRDVPPTEKDSFWSLLRKTYKSSGWRGLFRGYGLEVLNAGVTFITGLAATRLFPVLKSIMEGDKLSHPRAQLVWTACTALIVLPLEVLATRAQVAVAAAAPGRSIRSLFTDDDGRRTLRASLFTPSIVLVSILPGLLVDLTMLGLGPYTATLSGQDARRLSWTLALGLGLLQTPLRVVFVRLAASEGLGRRGTEHDEKGGPETGGQYPTQVTTVRPAPYEGGWHCVSSMVSEEGWQTLFRGWIVEAVFLLFKAEADLQGKTA